MGDIAGSLGQMASNVGQATGIPNIVSGIGDVFTGGGQTPVMGQPGAPELVGPPSPVQSPNFLQGFAQGFTGMVPGQGADVPLSAGGEVGGGLGQLFHAIEQLRSGGLTGNVAMPLAQTVGRHLAGVEMAPGYRPSTAPQGGLIHRIIQGLTFGILDTPKMGP